MAKDKKANEVSDRFKDIKNPLSQAFGLVLKTYRLRYYSEPDAIANALKIQPSYYRGVESGSYNLHISNAIKLFEAFDGRFSYEAIEKLLAVISIIEATIKEDSSSATYFSAFESILSKIAIHDDRLNVILNRLTESGLFKHKIDLKNDEVIRLISDNRLDILMEEFLVNYSTFGKSRVELQNKFPNEFFKDIPTNQIDLFVKLKEYAIKQPTSYNSKASWQWEKRNCHLFKYCYILHTEPEILTGIKNLTNYIHDYLWEKEFEKTYFLFVAKGNGREYKELFKKNLREAYEKLDSEEARKKLKHFDNIVDKKVEMKCTTDSEYTAMADPILNGVEKGVYNAFWIFSLKDFSNVAVRAILSGAEAHLAPGDYLLFEETLKELQAYKTLWAKV